VKLTDAMVEGLRTLAHGMMPRTNTVQALQRRGLVAEDYTLTNNGILALGEVYPSEARALMTPVPAAKVIAPAISVALPGGDTLEIPPTVLEDAECDDDDAHDAGQCPCVPEGDTTDLEVCDDCAQLIANGGCEGCESCVLTPYFTEHGEPDPEADCQTVNDRFMAKWGDQWAGVVLGEGSRESWGSVDSCDGCGSDVPGTRHAATFVPRFAEDWKRYPDRRKARESLRMRGAWNRSKRRHVA